LRGVSLPLHCNRIYNWMQIITGLNNPIAALPSRDSADAGDIMPLSLRPL
jgi:hypothetical protein